MSIVQWTMIVLCLLCKSNLSALLAPCSNDNVTSTFDTILYAHEQVEFASWGTGVFLLRRVGHPLQRRINVTAELIEYLRITTDQANVCFHATNAALYVADPAPGYAKTLQIIFTLESGLEPVVIKQGQPYWFHNGVRSHARHSASLNASPLLRGVETVAHWGIPPTDGNERWIDVSNRIGICEFVASTKLLGDPAPGTKPKVLSLYWPSIGGGVVYENEPVPSASLFC